MTHCGTHVHKRIFVGADEQAGGVYRLGIGRQVHLLQCQQFFAFAILKVSGGQRIIAYELSQVRIGCEILGLQSGVPQTLPVVQVNARALMFAEPVMHFAQPG